MTNKTFTYLLLAFSCVILISFGCKKTVVTPDPDPGPDVFYEMIQGSWELTDRWYLLEKDIWSSESDNTCRTEDIVEVRDTVTAGTQRIHIESSYSVNCLFIDGNSDEFFQHSFMQTLVFDQDIVREQTDSTLMHGIRVNYGEDYYTGPYRDTTLFTTGDPEVSTTSQVWSHSFNGVEEEIDMGEMGVYKVKELNESTLHLLRIDGDSWHFLSEFSGYGGDIFVSEELIFVKGE